MPPEHQIVSASDVHKIVMPGVSRAHFSRVWRRWKTMEGFPEPAPGFRAKWFWGHLAQWFDRHNLTGSSADGDPLDQASVDYTRRMANAAAALSRPRTK